MSDTPDDLPEAEVPYSAPADQWWPSGYDLPAFRVKRQTYGLMNGGDWVRGSSVINFASYRPSISHYGSVRLSVPVPSPRPSSTPGRSTITPSRSCGAGRSPTSQLGGGGAGPLLLRPPVDAARRGDGLPGDAEGVRTPLARTRCCPAAPLVYDQPLPSGYWYYYTLFFRTNPIDWVVGMSDACLLPRDYHHRDHMWDVVPPYYQWVDDNYRVGAGHLRQFLTVFGFVLDNTREFVEGMLDLHHLDKTPMPLLKGLGANYGLPYEAGIGDIRYRGLVANAPNAQHTRGTAVGVQQLIEAVSKYETEITGSQTMMLFPDDSDFYNSTGNWGGLHPDAVAPVLAQEASLTSLSWDNIYVARVQKAPHVGRGVMRVYTSKAQQTSSLLIACGDSRIRDDPDTVLQSSSDTLPPVTTEYRDALPLSAGISVIAGVPYGFSVWVQAPEKNFTVQAVLIWIGPSGEPREVIDVSLGIPGGSEGTAWKQYIAQGIAPERTDTTVEARYLIPAIYIFDRIAGTYANRSAAIDVCGAMVYRAR